MNTLTILLCSSTLATADTPKPTDDRLTVELFAEHPDIVTPTGIAVDADGRVFVAESHTHFRPEGYDGPEHDRILIFEDTDGDGKADKRTVSHEGFTYLMDLEFHPDGSLYAATRMDIHRFRDGKPEPIIRMETEGTYPHNGLSGLAFDAEGDLHFGLGENLGRAYTLIGTDGVRISGGDEGGSTYHVRADGTGLRRVSTGWWNPFGMCVHQSGRVFGTDNDPDASPPCRLIQVVEGGDYGYEFRYGRSGLHPLTTWTGDIPGTLPMVAGTGEAPGAVIACDGEEFPEGYHGDLLVAAWADHSVERYELTQSNDAGLINAERRILIEGGPEFRPVGLAQGPDGSVYVSDWVSSSYELHGKGRIWRIRPTDTVGKGRPARAEPGLRELRERLREDGEPARWAAVGKPLWARAEALLRLNANRHPELVADALESRDPLVFHSGIEALSRGMVEPSEGLRKLQERHPVAWLLATKRQARTRGEFAEKELGKYLGSADDDVRFTAVKWIADDELKQYRPTLAKLLDRADLDLRSFLAVNAALDRLDGKRPSDMPATDRLLAKLRDENTPAAIRALALRLLDPSEKRLRLTDLEPLLSHPDARLRIEAVRTLARRPEPQRLGILKRVLADQRMPTAVRAEAVAGLGDFESEQATLTQLAVRDDALRADALRALVNAGPSEELRKLGPNEAVARLFDGSVGDRPTDTDTDAWLKLLDGDGDPVAGERVFFDTRTANCASCHRVEGRGNAVGPDLTAMRRRTETMPDGGRRWWLETTLQPSRETAPEYTTWVIETADGRLLTGLPRRKGGNAEAYLGTDGEEFTLRKADILSHRESPISVMPTGLLRNLTRQELRDLFAFLTRRRESR